MKLTDIQIEAVREALDDMRTPFRTKDLSKHKAMVEAHRSFYDHDTHYHAIVGLYLSKNDSDLNIRCRDRAKHTRGALWENETDGDSPASARATVTVPSLPRVQDRASSRPVRDGHYRSIEYMATPEFLRVKGLFESIPEIGGVYFRPIDKGIAVVDLHPESPKPRIGVGSDPYIRCGATAAALASTMDERVAHLRDARDRQARPSRENQFEAFMIREAQSNHLRLPGCSDKLRFIYGQWRMDPDSDGSPQFTDLIAVDIVERQLVILELKPQPDNSALHQVQGYVQYFNRYWDDLAPFFTRVAQVMGELYGCPELVSLDCLNQEVVPLVAWPGANGKPVLNGGDQ